MQEQVLLRSELAQADKWAIEDLYETNEAWEADLARLRALGGALPGYAGKLGSSAETLLSYLKLDEEISVLLDRLANYAQRRCDEDTTNTMYQELLGRLTKLCVDLSADTAFVLPELLAIEDETLERFYSDAPELTLYRRHFDSLRRRKKHILSEQEEKLLAMAGDMARTPEEVYSLFADADLTFRPAKDQSGAEHTITQGSYIAAMESPDRVLRKNAFESLYAGFGAYRNSLAAMLAGQNQQLAFFAKARRYASPLEAALDETEVPVEVYHQLIAAVNQNLDKLHRYMRLRKKLMGLDELHMYDIYTPLVQEADEKIPFAEAKKTVAQALGVLGEDYGAILQEGFESRWIDVYENRGKRSGAYSAGARVHPYVLLNYTGTLDSEFTLAHEMGHALHSYLSNKNQPVIYSDYVIFVAEVASTCNEALLMQHLLKTTTDKTRRAYLMNHFLEQFRTTLYRQTMFAEFELTLAELTAQSGTLTADALCEKYKELNARYYADAVVLDEEIALEWARIPHFYYNYYVFQYATGYAAAIALSTKILQEGAPAVERYLRFLSGGCSKSPIALLKDAGVDMTTAEPVNQALELFGALLDEMEALMA